MVRNEKKSYLVQNSTASCIDVNTDERIFTLRNGILSLHFSNSHCCVCLQIESEYLFEQQK